MIAEGDVISFLINLPSTPLTGSGRVLRLEMSGHRVLSFLVMTDDGRTVHVFPDEILR